MENEPIRKNYGAIANNAPTLVRSAGLLQALAFYEAKGEEHHVRLLQNLETELRELGILPADATLRTFVMNCDLVTYMRLTQEVLALCQWHKRFAQSVLKVEPGEEGA
jgi:CRISPR-associated protein Cmr5